MAFDPDDVIIDGLAKYVELSGDQQDVQMGAAVYKSVADAFRSRLSPGVTCALAFPSMIIRPEIRAACFVAILDSEVVIAWKKGTFKKSLQTEIVPKNEITSGDVETSSSGATRGATLMKITAGMTVTFALPKGRPDIWSAIGEAIFPSQPIS